MAEPSVLRRCLERKAVIYAGEYSGAYAAYPGGDRRRRPVAWLDQQQLTRFLASGALTQRKNAYHISRSYVRRLENPNAANAHADQHRELEDREVYIPEGVKRTARVNRRLSPLRILSRQTHADGARFLSDAKIEAGERFARDYDHSHMGNIATQDYGAIGGSRGGPRQNNGQEAIFAHQQDARNRVMAALAHVGTGLDRAVMAVCAHERTLDSMERTENWAKNSGKTVLKLALQKLVTFYGTQPGIRS